ncbi:protein arginine N-methyltransferase 7 [Strigomonas culicis]|nr:protein arginine N-methyltransferase 7 [Strigomonas culicis]|eukprot:EPY27785.1 protein arginine N-methyltransferase 7 [Strigomonas culicis]
MMNDHPRNAFYYHLLKQHIVPGETGVLEIGAGSGLLSMMAARLGAKWVVAVEGSYEMAQLAKRNVKQNQLEGTVTVLHMLSTDLQKRDLPGTPDVLVSEIFGTLLLGESALDYIVDVRQRGIIDPHKTAILPQRGVQYAVPVHSDTLSQITTVQSWRDLNLSQVTRLQDSCSVVFTKQYGFRLSSMPYTCLATAPVELLRVDFSTSRPQDYKKQFPVRVTAREDGTAQAWMLYWVAEHDVLPPAAAAAETLEEAAKDRALIVDEARHVYYMSTKPEDTRDNFPRDMQWGQALQLIDCTQYKQGKNKAEEGVQMPSYLPMEKGATYEFNCSLSQDRVVMHLQYKKKVEEDDGKKAQKAAAATTTAEAAVEEKEAKE